MNNRNGRFLQTSARENKLRETKVKTQISPKPTNKRLDLKLNGKAFVKRSPTKSISENKFKCPFKITEILQNSAICHHIQTNETDKINLDSLKPYFERKPSDFQDPLQSQLPNTPVYNIVVLLL